MEIFEPEFNEKIWLCDAKGSSEVKATASPVTYVANTEQFAKGLLTEVSQDISVFRSAVLATATALAVVPAVASAGTTDPAQARILFGLQRDVDGLNALAGNVSNPASDAYRSYAPVPVIARRYGASDATVAAVRATLRNAGFTRSILDVTRGFLVVPATAAQLNALEGRSAPMEIGGPGATAALARLRSGAGGLVTEIVTQEPGLTPLARETQSSWAPGLRWPAHSGTAKGCAQGAGTALPPPTALPASASSTVFTPNQFQVAFGMAPLHRAGVQGQGQHIALFESGAGVKRADLTTFARCFGLPVPNMRIVPVGQSRQLDPVSAGGGTVEAQLDVQALMLAAPRARITMVQGNDIATMPEIMSTTLDSRRMRGLPDVVSVSYAVCEAIAQGGSAAPFLSGSASRRLTDWVMATGAGAGVSILVAAGDSGAQGCAHNIGSVPLGPQVPGAVAAAATNYVLYPASSPWATAVGGTTMTLNRDNTIRTQAPWNDRTSVGVNPMQEKVQDGVPVLAFAAGGGTGGSSMLYGTPAWQRAAGIQSTRRLVPDVSMFASWGVVMTCSAWDPTTRQGPCPPGAPGWPFMSVAGTSFAAPLLAGGVALANQRARAAGQANAGFIAPLLYGPARSAIRDVTRGNNDVFGTGRCCFAGPGYDQATGLGTVNAARLANAVVSAGR